MQGIEPGGPGQVFTAILAGLEKIPAGIPVAEHALQAFAQEAFVGEFRNVAPVPAVVAQQSQGRLEESVIHREALEGSVHVTIIYIHRCDDEKIRQEKPRRTVLCRRLYRPRYPGVGIALPERDRAPAATGTAPAGRLERSRKTFGPRRIAFRRTAIVAPPSRCAITPLGPSAGGGSLYHQ